MAEYKKMKLEDVFADIEKIMGADASDEEKSMQLRKKAASAYEQEDDPTAAAYYERGDSPRLRRGRHAAGDSFPRRRELCEA